MDNFKGKPDWDSKATTRANNTPVGSAGQPGSNDAKMNAISRRIAAKRKKDAGAKN